MLPRAKTGSKRLHRCKLPPAQHVPNELTESFDHWEGRFLRDLSSHRRRSVRGGRLGLVKGCPHVLHAAWLWPPSGHAWQPETACGGTVTRLSDTQRSNFCCALHSWQAQSRARAPVCAPVRVNPPSSPCSAVLCVFMSRGIKALASMQVAPRAACP